MNNLFCIQEAAELSTIPPKIVSDDNKILTFIAVLQESDKYNRNRRIYTKELLNDGMSSPSVQERIATHNFVGEAGHPLQRSDKPECNMARQKWIDHSNISHFILDWWWEGNLLKGKIQTANSTIGNEFANFIRQGMIPAFSLRAQGNVIENPDKSVIVAPPLGIISYDWVLSPSNASAYMEKLCESTKDIMLNLPKYNNNYQMALNESSILYSEGYMEKAKNLPIKDYRNATMFRTKDQLFVYRQGATKTLSEDCSTVTVNDGLQESILSTNEFIMKELRYVISKSL